MDNRPECSIPCNLCGSESVEVLSLTDRNGNYLRTVICRECGLIWSDPRSDEEQIKEFYSNNYRREYKNITRPKKKHVYRIARDAMWRYRFLKDILQPGDSGLDIGAGNGIFVYSLRKLGFNVRGIEPDKNHSKYAATELKVPVTTEFSQDIKEQEEFDFVTLHHVLEHMTDPLAELNNIYRLLKNGGYLALEVPNAEDIRQDPGNRYHKAHIYTFNPETLVALGHKAGFKLFRIEIAPLNGNISVVFQKADPTDPTDPKDLNEALDLSGNYQKITSILNHWTNFRHFTSPVPYRKLFQNALTAIDEWIECRKFQTDEEIIDSVILSINDGFGEDRSLSGGFGWSGGVGKLRRWSTGVLAVLIILAVFGGWQVIPKLNCPVSELFEQHQDGNDSFYLLMDSRTNKVYSNRKFKTVKDLREIERKLGEDDAQGLDAHFLISEDSLAQMENSVSQLGLNKISEFEIDGARFVLLSSEDYSQQSELTGNYFSLILNFENLGNLSQTANSAKPLTS